MADVQVIKRGATFRWTIGLTNDLRGASFKAQVRAMGSERLIADLAIREVDVDEAVVLELESPTADWPITNLSADVQAVLADETVYSETIQIQVVRNVTV